MRSVLDENDRETLCGRLALLEPSSAARWGRMTAGEMLTHLRSSARMALGELAVKPKNMRAFQMFPLKHLFLYVLPFPKGAPTAPELLAVQPSSFEDDRATLRELIRRLGALPRDAAGPAHPLFGPLSRREWGVLTYKHWDHHLRQFGV